MEMEGTAEEGTLTLARAFYGITGTYPMLFT
jgi:hypothetical protein